MRNIVPPLKTSKKIGFTTTIVISFLIFFSIIPLASAEVWWEAVVFAVIFLVSGISIWINQSEKSEGYLLTPLYILAGYSFFQGFITFLLQAGFSDYPAAFPQSFDAAASIWSAFKIFAFALFFKLLLNNFRQKVKFLTFVLILTGNFFAVFGILRFLFHHDFPGAFENFVSSRLAAGVGFGTYFNQNHFAYLMLMVFGLNLSLFWYGSDLKKLRFLLLPSSLLAWTALVLTGSRGGITGSFIEIAVLILLPLIYINRKKNSPEKGLLVFRQLAILGVFSGILTIGIFLIGQERVVERFEDISHQIGGVTNAATFRRTDVWLATAGIIKDYPVFGTGFGGFHTAVSQYIDISGQLVPKEAHNDYLEFAAAGGIIAVGLAVWFLFLFFALVKKGFSEPSDSFSLAVRAGAICGISGVALHSLFDFGLQITANLLFFAALIFLAIHQPEGTFATNASSQKSNAVFKITFSTFCLLLALAAAFFGLARFQNEKAKAGPSLELIENSLVEIPFDAEYFITKAAIFENSGKTELAADELKRAIKYRPKDYNLWLKSAQIEQSLNCKTEAENAFRRSIELAPRFAEPRFLFGKFLVENRRQEEGFKELRFASLRNPGYFNEIAALVSSEKSGQAEEIIKFFSPFSQPEREQLVLFLFDKNEFAAVVRLVCREEDLTAENRESLIRKFFEKKLYRLAEQIDERNCDNPNFVKNKIEDGNFEDKNVNEGMGFGWRILSISDYTKVTFDAENPAKGRSLRFDYNGQEPSYALLSQIVTVEAKRKYQLRFSYKKKKIITGGVPVFQVLLKQEKAEFIAGEAKLSLNEAGWIQTAIDFETSPQTEAVEIRLTRDSCGQSLCPIFGTLWLDDFALERK